SYPGAVLDSPIFWCSLSQILSPLLTNLRNVGCTRSKIYKPLPGKKTARSHLSNRCVCLPFKFKLRNGITRMAFSSVEYLFCG
ncbi:hypothetical protein, partial [Nostoc sp.]|uniref:hypothetical protein n=1 Tax=Nostoc sp. TaxID=1180 RepID=UPI002FFCC352